MRKGFMKEFSKRQSMSFCGISSPENGKQSGDGYRNGFHLLITSVANITHTNRSLPRVTTLRDNTADNQLERQTYERH